MPEPAAAIETLSRGPPIENVLATRQAPAGLDIRPSRAWAAATDLLRWDLSFVPELEMRPGDGRFVVEADGDRDGRSLTLTLTLRETESDRQLARTYRGVESGLRAFVHEFADDAVLALTGTAGGFRSRMVFARRVGPGRKNLFMVDPDGEQLHQLPTEEGIAMLPSLAADHVWYTVVTRAGAFITHSGRAGAPVIDGPGDDLGPTVCGDRVFFTSTREGNSEIHSAGWDGSDVRRLTDDPGIDISPACGPDGLIAFVSNRSGSPQIHLMDADGENVRLLTAVEGEGQTPVFCSDPAQRLVAFTVVRRSGNSIFLHDLRSGRTWMASPEGKDPAFSPDCRMLAFVTSHGIVISRIDGAHARVILQGPAETIRWSR